MHSSILALVALAAGAAAQTGYGRFPCTIVNGDGTFSADPTQCVNAALVAPGAADDSGNQGDGLTPTNPICTEETESGAFFCGIAGAACTTDANCDNGLCVGGQCQGGFTQACASTDANCLGYLYCLSGDFSTTPLDTCGAVGAFCQDPIAVDPSLSAAAAQPIYNSYCSTGYCNSGTGSCDVIAAVGASCATDPDFQCGANAFCDATSLLCVANSAPSGGARQRRNAHAKKSLCPASHSACAVQGARGFECVDTTSNLEQCGACATAGGADCTAIEGAESVGCVAGVCEVWSCTENFSWSADLNACVASN